jgi:long-chain acyl-CoA synthetase
MLVTGGAGSAGARILERLLATSAMPETLVVTHDAPVSPHPNAVPIAGDVTHEGLGLDPAVGADVAARTTAILHMAADTRFGAPLETLRRVNADGTRRVLAFARRCRRLERIVALSTVYVAGRRRGRILEEDLEHDAGFVNDYERSKYEAERLLREAMRDLPVSVVRLSTIVGDGRDGSVGRPGAIHHALRFYYQSLAPMLPGEPSSRVDLIDLDYAAAAVAACVGDAFRPAATWHVCAGDEAPALDALLDDTLECFLRFRPAWRRRAIEKPAIVPLETFERFARSVEELQDSALSRSVALVRPFAPQLAYPKIFDDTATRRTLDRVGVRRRPFSDFYPRIVRHLIEHQWPAAAAVAS